FPPRHYRRDAPRPAQIRQVRAGGVYKGRKAPVPRVLLSATLAGPAPSGGAGTSRLCQGCSRPPRHHPDQAAPSFTILLRQDRGEGLSPPLEQSEVGPERPVSVTTGGFLRAASRTRRAPLSAPGSPQAPGLGCCSCSARPRCGDLGAPVVVAPGYYPGRVEQGDLAVGGPDAVAPAQLPPGRAPVLALLPPGDFLP